MLIGISLAIYPDLETQQSTDSDPMKPLRVSVEAMIPYDIVSAAPGFSEVRKRKQSGSRSR